jgi:NAD(P)H-hydrate epimerase
MKILTAQQIRELDRFTIKNESISSYELMERAADACYGMLPYDDLWFFSTVYVCGKGNNGGDGLAMARMQSEEDEQVLVVIIEHTKEGSPDFAHNLYLLEEEGKVPIVRVRSMADFPEIEDDALIVDAILGTGLSRPLEGLLADVVRHINTLNCKVVSVDMPTGLFADDNASNTMDTVIRANQTNTFHCPKMSMLLPETGEYAGELVVLNIGLMDKEMNPPSNYEFVQRDELKKLYRERPKFSHKGTFGHALLVAGSKGKMGAAQLAASACLRSGAGLLTAHVPACGSDIMQVGVTEAMCTVDSNSDYIIDLPNLSPFNAIGVGPGIGTEKDTTNVLKRLLQDADARLVIDADGLNILGENKTWLSFLPQGTVLTPHPKEFERLVGKWDSSAERLQLQTDFSKKYSVVVVLKGAHTCTTTPSGQVFFNSTGNAGMATAGCGDVLTGIILGLLAQGYSPEVAAVMGTYLHGSAGDMALRESSKEALLAHDIVTNLGKAFAALSANY